MPWVRAAAWITAFAAAGALSSTAWAQGDRTAPFTYTPASLNELPGPSSSASSSPKPPVKRQPKGGGPATKPPPAADAVDAFSGDASDTSSDTSEDGFGAPPPVATIRMHGYTLAECLALADRNHPFVWAARARLHFVHAQLDEAKWTPFSSWSASSNIAVAPPVVGTPLYTSTPASVLGSGFFNQRLEPVFTFDISGAIPLYTFGKITEARESAEANVRVNEWDMEKVRQQIRMDVRRAYYGLMLARDARYVLGDVESQLDKAIKGVVDRLARDDQAVEEIDRIRLETYRDELHARAGDVDRGERFGIAALRFMTGTQTAFDIPDQPLKRPVTPLGPVTRYLTAARLFRPEVNQARAGVVAREHWAAYMRAQLFPDIGLGLAASYAIAPSVTIQNQAFTSNTGSNHFFAPAFGLGIRWSLDLLPRQARANEAEAQLEETRAMERAALGGIAVEVENAYGVALEASTREAAWEAGEHRARRWISIIQDDIDLGTKDERSLNEPLRAFVNARVNHLYALMDMNVAFSDLARVTGVDEVAPPSN